MGGKPNFENKIFSASGSVSLKSSAHITDLKQGDMLPNSREICLDSQLRISLAYPTGMLPNLSG